MTYDGHHSHRTTIISVIVLHRPILTAINAITIEATMITSCLSPPTLMIAVSALLFDKLRIRSK